MTHADNQKPLSGRTTVKPGFLARPLIHVLLIVVLGLLAYANTFQVPFVFDDESSIIDNPVIKNLADFRAESAGHSHIQRRFVSYLTFALNYHFGGLDVTGYHVFNLAVHISASLLVYALVRLTFRTPFFAGTRNEERGTSISGFSNLEPRTSNLVPLLAALLFVVHPVQTQAVTYVVQRLASLATMFYLLSLVLYAKARLASSHRSPVTSHQSRSLVSLLCYLGSLLAALLAMKSKEIAFTLPLAIVLYEFSFFKATARKKLLFLLPVLLTIVIVPISLMSAGGSLGELLSDLSEHTRDNTPITRWDYLLTQFRVIVTYIRLLFLPVNQNLDYDYPVYHSLFAPPVFLSFLLILAMVGLAVWLFYRSRFTVNQSPVTSHQSPVNAFRLVSFGILWFFITLSVESSVIPLRDVIFEHRLYLPSVGAFIALAAAAALVLARYPAAIAVLALVVLAYGGATWKRNMIWGDQIAIWRDAASKSPHKARVHYNLGKAFSAKEETEKAIEEYLIALRITPDDATIYNNLGVMYGVRGELDRAIAYYRIALRLEPGHKRARQNIADALELAELNRLAGERGTTANGKP